MPLVSVMLWWKRGAAGNELHALWYITAPPVPVITFLGTGDLEEAGFKGWGRDQRLLKGLKELSSVTAHVQAALISMNLSVGALFLRVELLIPASLVFTVSVSQRSWYSEGWIDETGGSKKQQTDYCSLLLICQIKESSPL